MERQITQFECDKCGKPGERYTVAYPDGIKILDRCTTHNKKLLSLKDEPGEFSETTGQARRGQLIVLSPAEILEKKTQ